MFSVLLMQATGFLYHFNPALKEGVINTMNIEPNVKATEQESAAAESAAQDQATGADGENAEEGGTEG